MVTSSLSLQLVWRSLKYFSIFGLLLVFLTATAVAEDLGKKYTANLDYSKQFRAYNWTSGQQDVWILKSFHYKLADDFEIKLGPSQVVFGCHGTNVLWAAVFADKPGNVLSAGAGKGEHITSVWMRFHPALVGNLFPSDTVGEQGDVTLVEQAKELAHFKMRSSWQNKGRPVIPLRESIIFDLETKEGSRRFYVIDTGKNEAKYVDAFRQRTLPVATPLKDGGALEIFDTVWNAFDREYAMFMIKPDVDWQSLRKKYRPLIAKAKSNRELAQILNEMLKHLKDLHVYVKVDGNYVQGFNRERFFNASPAAAAHLIGSFDRRKGLRWGQTKDGIGYIAVDNLVNESLPRDFEMVLKEMKGTRGLILDLRANGGGSEPLGAKLAGFFVDRPRVYAMHQYRNGDQHSDLGTKQKRTFAPNKNWYYRGPVIVLQGEKTMSSAEAFVLMLAQCPNVTTMGDRTAGSSGNPRQLNPGAGIIVNLPRWIALDMNAKPLDSVGVQPDVKVKATHDDFTKTQDPILKSALKQLRKKIEEQKATSEATLIPRS
ncbi:S41 family peptidase [Gimesia aquarii]|uniref:Carboxy-terminal processing protease CtpA n=1 Tax=Gimesia aquarii TaxID=2527964 RepID=A0A517WVG7_9PLAN|nr:S41 family peptidase [Gimesia aquarii]QDU09234.1 Carboxy-terminal processing protease CtpA precursor [Gimesia aquarii]